jgi:hypothetical protein
VWCDELAGARHPAMRCMIDNKGAKRQIESGTDTVASAPYLRSKNNAHAHMDRASCATPHERRTSTVRGVRCNPLRGLRTHTQPGI